MLFEVSRGANHQNLPLLLREAPPHASLGWPAPRASAIAAACTVARARPTGPRRALHGRGHSCSPHRLQISSEVFAKTRMHLRSGTPS